MVVVDFIGHTLFGPQTNQDAHETKMEVIFR